MDQKEKINFFNENLHSIFGEDSNLSIDFISDIIEDKKVRDGLLNWPIDIKIKIVDKFLSFSEVLGEEDIGENSWSEFYEMYDGKFDEKYMIFIVIDSRYINELEDLGYTKQSSNNLLQNPQEGEYQLNEQGHMIVVHSCPDREIFGTNPEQFLEEIGIKDNWVIKTSLEKYK